MLHSNILVLHTRIAMNSEYINQTKENFKLLETYKNKIFIIPSTVSADEYEYSSKTRQIYSVG